MKDTCERVLNLVKLYVDSDKHQRGTDIFCIFRD